MPMTYRISRHVVRFTKRSDVKYNEVLAVLKGALEEAREAHPDIARWDMIVDLRQSAEIRTDMELRGLAMALTQQMPVLSGKVAAVVTDPTVTKRMRELSALAVQAGYKLRVFRTIKEAEAWLKSGRSGR